ncbi:DNA-binding MarR family transcriptional regulator [Melaminivora alkalimesophila]|uniref:DNA-binding MarR family transcriptional regulator n=2 Tax=Melaminivora alkalimesophila TaxID=1165852 RepID=A0A317REG5_9BURK|nr:MarR family transcriptional regulator [Melaminivora alkalimesophila]PWW47085.1 DNA-binding MarR family transcriptional regulator [Melaminivora alkalimesophila]
MPDSCPSVPGFASERSIGLQLRRIVIQLGQAIDRRMEPLALTDAQWKPLVQLLRHEHPPTATALARDCHIDSGGLTRLLDRLQAKGLCRRERSPQDRRVVHVVLTEAGRAVALQLPAVLAEVQAQLLQGLDAEAQDQLRRHLAQLEANLEQLAAPPLPAP